MAHTDKDRPSRVRLRELGADEYVWRGRIAFSVPNDFKWTNAEKGLGPKEARWAKRYRSKRNRRRELPHQFMRGYGYGDDATIQLVHIQGEQHEHD